MLVRRDEFFKALQRLCDSLSVALDTETTGLKAYHADHLFCIVAATATEEFYFNFHPEHPECLDRSLIRHFSRLTHNVLRHIYMANAKFDMAMLGREGVSNWQAQVHDVLAIQRLFTSDMMKVNLGSVAKKWGFEKSEAVEAYIKEHKLWEWVHIPGKKTREKNKFFSKVPFDVMMPYALKDARITYNIGTAQEDAWAKYTTDWPKGLPDPKQIEFDTTKACFNLERRGILIDPRFCEAQAAHHEDAYKQAAREFFDLTGKKLVDSSKVLAPLFTAMGDVLPKTDKGKDSITDKWLARHPSRIAALIRDFRENSKLANTYYKAFLWHRDSNSLIHANIRQGGTRTGRFSYGVPNLQNVPKDGEARKAFVPRSEFILVSIDYDQQEYRLMLDYANEPKVIEDVLGGMDIHTATANMMGVERGPAKTLNFLLLYGGGIVKLAISLYALPYDEETAWAVFWHWIEKPEKAERKVTPEIIAEVVPYLEKAKALRDLYFERLKKVSALIQNVKTAAVKNRKVNTWTGRPLHFPNRNFAYKAPNALIQGGCSDIGKIGLINLDRFLSTRKSKLLLLVHDENLFEVHKDEIDLIPTLKTIMEQVYPARRLPLTCSVAWSAKSWGDLVDGTPSVEEARDEIQRESARRAKEAATHLGA